MKYIDSFNLPSFDQEARYEYPTKYPFSLFSSKDLYDIYFSNITIIYGGNGSGKSTLLNIINSKLGLERKSTFYYDEAYQTYVKMCKYDLSYDDDSKKRKIPQNSKIIASEDIFDFILSVRDKNIENEIKMKELADEYDQAKYSRQNYGLQDYDRLVIKAETQRTSKTKFINKRVNLIKQFSNGESVLRYFDSELENDGLYLLDEPENSLSPVFQIELLKLIVECSRYCDCQFIIATHSPFLLSIPGAKIYNLDITPVEVCKWTELENVKIYYDFFKGHIDEFE